MSVKTLPKPNRGTGYLAGKQNGKTVIHTDGDLGGVLVGARHSDGGIPAVNESTNKPLEVEKGEVSITSKAVTNTEVYNFDGQEMTAKEVLSKINSDAGGVKFKKGGTVERTYSLNGQQMTDKQIEQKLHGNKIEDKRDGNKISYSGGEIIITRPAVMSKETHNFCGSQLTNFQILSKINVDSGGIAFADDNADVSVKPNDLEYEFGGKVMKGYEIVEQYACGCKMEDGGVVNDYPTVKLSTIKKLQWYVRPDGKTELQAEINGEHKKAVFDDADNKIGYYGLCNTADNALKLLEKYFKIKIKRDKYPGYFDSGGEIADTDYEIIPAENSGRGVTEKVRITDDKGRVAEYSIFGGDIPYAIQCARQSLKWQQEIDDIVGPEGDLSEYAQSIYDNALTRYKKADDRKKKELLRKLRFNISMIRPVLNSVQAGSIENIEFVRAGEKFLKDHAPDFMRHGGVAEGGRQSNFDFLSEKISSGDLIIDRNGIVRTYAWHSGDGRLVVESDNIPSRHGPVTMYKIKVDGVEKETTDDYAMALNHTREYFLKHQAGSHMEEGGVIESLTPQQQYDIGNYLPVRIGGINNGCAWADVFNDEGLLSSEPKSLDYYYQIAIKIKPGAAYLEREGFWDDFADRMEELGRPLSYEQGGRLQGRENCTYEQLVAKYPMRDGYSIGNLQLDNAATGKTTPYCVVNKKTGVLNKHGRDEMEVVAYYQQIGQNTLQLCENPYAARSQEKALDKDVIEDVSIEMADVSQDSMEDNIAECIKNQNALYKKVKASNWDRLAKATFYSMKLTEAKANFSTYQNIEGEFMSELMNMCDWLMNKWQNALDEVRVQK